MSMRKPPAGESTLNRTVEPAATLTSSAKPWSSGLPAPPMSQTLGGVPGLAFSAAMHPGGQATAAGAHANAAIDRTTAPSAGSDHMRCTDTPPLPSCPPRTGGRFMTCRGRLARPDASATDRSAQFFWRCPRYDAEREGPGQASNAGGLGAGAVASPAAVSAGTAASEGDRASVSDDWKAEPSAEIPVWRIGGYLRAGAPSHP